MTVAADWDFPSYEAVVRRANRTQADLIVADLHHGNHAAAGLLHLTDWELIRLSNKPVLLVKTRSRYRKPVILAALDPAQTRNKPAGLDQEILAMASTLTEALEGPLHAMHAYIPAPPPIWPTDSDGAASLSRRLAQRERARPTHL